MATYKRKLSDEERATVRAKWQGLMEILSAQMVSDGHQVRETTMTYGLGLLELLVAPTAEALQEYGCALEVSLHGNHRQGAVIVFGSGKHGERRLAWLEVDRATIEKVVEKARKTLAKVTELRRQEACRKSFDQDHKAKRTELQALGAAELGFKLGQGTVYRYDVEHDHPDYGKKEVHHPFLEVAAIYFATSEAPILYNVKLSDVRLTAAQVLAMKKILEEAQA